MGFPQKKCWESYFCGKLVVGSGPDIADILVPLPLLKVNFLRLGISGFFG